MNSELEIWVVYQFAAFTGGCGRPRACSRSGIKRLQAGGLLQNRELIHYRNLPQITRMGTDNGRGIRAICEISGQKSDWPALHQRRQLNFVAPKLESSSPRLKTRTDSHASPAITAAWAASERTGLKKNFPWSAQRMRSTA